MSDAMVSGLLAGYGVAVPVGAIAVLIMGLSARGSLLIGVGAGLGTATADGLYALIAVAGGAAVTGLIRPVTTPLRLAAAVLLVGLAGRTAWPAWRAHRTPVGAAPAEPAPVSVRQPAEPAPVSVRQPAEPAPVSVRQPGRLALTTPLRAYGGLLGLTLLNPATVVYFSALVLGTQAGQARSLVASGLFVVAAFLASASWQLLLAAGGSVLGRVLSGPRGRLGTALVSSAVIMVLALRLVVTA